MAKRQNIILIVADDMGYGDFGIFNDGPAQTPHLDALVHDGVCLSQHYAGSPVCSPSRSALLTGRYPHRTGALVPMEVRGRDRIALDEVTIGDTFKHAGYATGLIGKWHNGAFDDRYHPNARGFDEFVGFRGGWMDYFNWWIERNGRRETADGRYLTDVFTAEAVDFVRRHRQEPFMLCVMYNAPHSPLQAPDEVVQPYLDAGMSPGVAITYAMNEIMDRGVGQIAQTLDELALRDDTILMFTSDNGPAFNLRPDQVPEGMDTNTLRYNCGFNGQKGSVYEGGIRVPMIMNWPGGLEGGVGSMIWCTLRTGYRPWPIFVALSGRVEGLWTGAMRCRFCAGQAPRPRLDSGNSMPSSPSVGSMRRCVRGRGNWCGRAWPKSHRAMPING